MKTINFYKPKDPFGCFSNFSKHSFKLKDKTWPTSEHYFQAMKFEGTKFEDAVRRCETPGEAADMGRDRALPLRSDWESVKDSVMKEALIAKFNANAKIKKELFDTGDAVLVEHTEKDSYWGDGGDGSGKNMLGKLLMEVREFFKNDIYEKEQKAIKAKEKFTELEVEFRINFKEASLKIKEELQTAMQAIKNAEEISNKTGVPFSSSVSTWHRDSYRPQKFVDFIESLSKLDQNGEQIDEFKENFYRNYGIEAEGYYKAELSVGWSSRHWNSSSLTC